MKEQLLLKWAKWINGANEVLRCVELYKGPSTNKWPKIALSPMIPMDTRKIINDKNSAYLGEKSTKKVIFILDNFLSKLHSYGYS